MDLIPLTHLLKFVRKERERDKEKYGVRDDDDETT